MNIGVKGVRFDSFFQVAFELLEEPPALCVERDKPVVGESEHPLVPLCGEHDAIGACLADTVSGAVVYIIPTAIIKIASALCFSSKTKKIISARNIIACILSAILCVGGYYIAEVVILGFDLVVPLASVPFNLIQAVSSVAIFLVLGAVFDKTNLKNKFIK